VPSALRPVLMGEAPRQVLLQALQDSPESRRSSRQTQLLKLLQGSGDADIAAARASDDPLLQLLACEAEPDASEALCLDQQIASGAALRLTLSATLPLVMVLLGSLLLLQQGWSLLRGQQEPSPSLEGPELTLIDMILLVAGGFVVISAVAMPLLALPLVGALTSALASPRREAVGVVINYSLMALPSLLILRRQLRALDPQRSPSGGWLQWGLHPPASALRLAASGWLMVTPVVTLAGWLVVKLVGDPGGSNPLLELVLGSRDPLALLLLLLTAVVLAPLFEEVIFRGTLLPVLASRVGSGPAVLLSALVFALAHLSIGELAPLTVLGIGLGLLRLRGGRLLPCVLMHALWNGITFLNLLLL
jgi:membrane protease YdiL (CAAX protease family)